MAGKMAIERVIEGHARDLGGFTVSRVLPAGGRQMVGPFIFFDHIGPAVFEAGQGIDVRPHPHIGLATVTYLFEGELMHRDSLGFVQPIRPGDVNWMTAGRGIAHSERTDAQLRKQRTRLHGLQSWVALPAGDEEIEPAFHHHPGATLPALQLDGVQLRVIAGTAYDARSPVATRSATLYVHAQMPRGSTLRVSPEHRERAIYVVGGRVVVQPAGVAFEAGRLVVLLEGVDVEIHAEDAAQVMLLGGEPLGPRYIWWNFVSSSRERIERAKQEWAEQRFARVPGETEFIPLPD